MENTFLESTTKTVKIVENMFLLANSVTMQDSVIYEYFEQVWNLWNHMIELQRKH